MIFRLRKPSDPAVVRSAGQPSRVVAQAYATYTANLAGALVVGTHGPAPAPPGHCRTNADQITALKG
jgi:hypothetical protein